MHTQTATLNVTFAFVLVEMPDVRVVTQMTKSTILQPLPLVFVFNL